MLSWKYFAVVLGLENLCWKSNYLLHRIKCGFKFKKVVVLSILGILRHDFTTILYWKSNFRFQIHSTEISLFGEFDLMYIIQCGPKTIFQLPKRKWKNKTCQWESFISVSSYRKVFNIFRFCRALSKNSIKHWLTAWKHSSLKPSLHISSKDRKHMVANMFFRISSYALVFT